MESDNSNGLMALFILVSFLTTISTVKVNTNGKIIENMKEIGKKIRCMA